MIIDTFSLCSLTPRVQVSKRIPDKPSTDFTTFLTHFVVDFDDYFLLDDRKILGLVIHPRKSDEGITWKDMAAYQKEENSRKMLPHTINLLLSLAFVTVRITTNGWQRTSQQCLASHWKKSLCNYRDYDLATQTRPGRRCASGKRAFGICHHNQSRKTWRNKQIYCFAFTMMFDEPEQIFIDFMHFYYSSSVPSAPLWRMVFVLCLLYELCFGRNINKTVIKRRSKDFQ